MAPLRLRRRSEQATRSMTLTRLLPLFEEQESQDRSRFPLPSFFAMRSCGITTYQPGRGPCDVAHLEAMSLLKIWIHSRALSVRLPALPLHNQCVSIYLRLEWDSIPCAIARGQDGNMKSISHGEASKRPKPSLIAMTSRSCGSAVTDWRRAEFAWQATVERTSHWSRL